MTKYDPELRLMAKRANERIRQLERKAPGSPALETVQSQLEMLGVKKKGKTGRRFGETGKAEDFNTINRLKIILNNFLSSQTSTISGFKKYYNDVWKSADASYNLSAKGVNKDDYFNIWKNLSNDISERTFGSEVYIRIVQAVMNRQEGMKYEDQLSVDEIMERINASKTLKDAYKSVGLTYKDIEW